MTCATKKQIHLAWLAWFVSVATSFLTTSYSYALTENPDDPVQGSACTLPWVYFDLGNTIVDTHTYNFEKILFEPGAFEYLSALKAKHYHLGLLVNFPDHYQGKDMTGDEKAKIEAIKQIVGSHWAPATLEPHTLDWSLFDDFFISPTDAQRKPAAFLFQRAFQLAKQAGCPSVFQGESPSEVQEAQVIGMGGYLAHVPGRPRFEEDLLK